MIIVPLRKKITTILEPSTELKDELTLTTDSEMNYAAFILKPSEMRGTESGSLIADLPRHSNIHKAEKLMDKYQKKVRNGEVLDAMNKKMNEKDVRMHRKYYADGFGSFLASKFERENGITFNFRGDVASHLTTQGNLFVQCNQSICSVFIPKNIKVDVSKFSIADRMVKS